MAWQLSPARRDVLSVVRPDGRRAGVAAASADGRLVDACLASRASPARSAAFEPVAMEAAAVRPACWAWSEAGVAGRPAAGHHQARGVRSTSPDVRKMVAAALAVLPVVAAPSSAV